MKLYATPLSHFSRKVRVLLDLYGADYELVDVGNVAEGPKEKFAGNPLSRVPVLVDGTNWIVDSDHIAEYVVSRLDPSDRYRVRSRDLEDLNIRAVLNGIMAEEVTLIVARRTGAPTEELRFFKDALESIREGLEWLEERADRFDATKPCFRELHLTCAWQHIEYYELLPLKFGKLRAVVDRVAADPIVSRTAPRVLRPRSV